MFKYYCICNALEVTQTTWTLDYLFPGERLHGGCRGLIPPDQWGAEPLHLTQIDEKRAI